MFAVVNNVHRHLEGDYSSGPWKYTPQKLSKPRRTPNWWLPVAVVGGILFWAWVLT